MHEVRYHGRLVARFQTDSEAQGYRTRRLSHEVEGPAFDKTALTVEPEKPFALFCLGNLVDTFDSVGDAEAALGELVAQAKENRRPAYKEEDFAIEKTKS